MAKLIRINRKLARRNGKLVLDTGGAPCCCGGVGDTCNECLDFPDATMPACDDCLNRNPNIACRSRVNGSGTSVAYVEVVVAGSVVVSANTDRWLVNQTTIPISKTIKSRYGTGTNCSFNLANTFVVAGQYNATRKSDGRVFTEDMSLGWRSSLFRATVNGGSYLASYCGDQDTCIGDTWLFDTVPVAYGEFTVSPGSRGVILQDLLCRGVWRMNDGVTYAQSRLSHGATTIMTAELDGTQAASMNGSCPCKLSVVIHGESVVKPDGGTGNVSFAFDLTMAASWRCIGPCGSGLTGGDQILDPNVARTLDLQARGGGCQGCGDGFAG